MKSTENSKTFDLEQNGSGDILFTIDGNQNVRLKNDGKLEITRGGLKLGGGSAACNPANKGMLEYTCGRPVYCNGTSWAPWPPGTQNRGKKMKAFVSSVAVDGHQASSGSFDRHCEELAAAAGLPGNFKAWISENSLPAASRFESPECSNSKYYLVDGTTKVADSLAEFSSGTIDHYIDQDEYGNQYEGLIWTGMYFDGSSFETCGNWRETTDEWGSDLFGIYGFTYDAFGIFAIMGTLGWGGADVMECYNALPFVCIEQPALPMSADYPRIFVTESTFTGDFTRTTPSPSSVYTNSGVGGAHAACQSEANARSLGGSWSAWIADNTSLGSSPVNYFKKSSGLPYTTLSKRKIADDWAHLTSGSSTPLYLGMAVDSQNQHLSGAPFIWSNVYYDGNSMGDSTCAATGDWTSAASGDSGAIGWPGIVTEEWSYIDYETCDQPGRFLCVEQHINPYSSHKKVFVTSTTTAGNMGGVAGADGICQARATAASLTGTFKAWIADNNASSAPATRFTQSAVPYRLLDGRVIATDWADLTDGNDSTGDSVITAININELGMAVNQSSNTVWTNVTNAGVRNGTTASCSNWSSAAGSGEFGKATQMYQWTEGDVIACNTAGRLYCFEQ